MKNPYMKKIRSIAHVTVWFVNGNWIRTNIDEEFTNFALYHKIKFPYIPKNEFWIDHETKEGEETFYIDNLLATHKYLMQGLPWKNAVKKAEIIEIKERARSSLVNKIKSKKQITKRIHKKLLKKYSQNGLKIWIVNGELVRDFLFLDFTEGGHGLIYNFIPCNEIWIDDQISVKERKFILLHELYERCLMLDGCDYNNSHKCASEAEFYLRHHTKKLDKEIGEVLLKKAK